MQALTLQAKTGRYTSKKADFTVSDNIIKTYELSGFARHNLVGSLLAVYFRTFGANKYLILKELF